MKTSILILLLFSTLFAVAQPTATGTIRVVKPDEPHPTLTQIAPYRSHFLNCGTSSFVKQQHELVFGIRAFGEEASQKFRGNINLRAGYLLHKRKYHQVGAELEYNFHNSFSNGFMAGPFFRYGIKRLFTAGSFDATWVGDISYKIGNWKTINTEASPTNEFQQLGVLSTGVQFWINWRLGFELLGEYRLDPTQGFDNGYFRPTARLNFHFYTQ